MKCPRTGVELREVEIGGIKVDISEGCGGVWFDNYEFEKFDEVHESGGEALIDLLKPYVTEIADEGKRLNSPRHPDVVMMRYFFSANRRIEIDECPVCGGIWLDPGELLTIREMFPTEAERRAHGQKFVEEMFNASGFQEEKEESAAFQKKSGRVANLFRWICPSKYIPGDQKWGAF